MTIKNLASPGRKIITPAAVASGADREWEALAKTMVRDG